MELPNDLGRIGERYFAASELKILRHFSPLAAKFGTAGRFSQSDRLQKEFQPR